MKFRDDINGLRALAVTMVVLYHFRMGVAPGGFVGVDVFFVISGFLMTQIITGRLWAGRFSLVEFYLARTRRIVPAMTVLVAATFAIGLCVLMPLQLASLAHSAFSSLLFFSNIQYSHEVGYFSAPPEGNWLIHTWSLSVEWQFYIVYPLALMALHRLGLRWRGVAACAALALAISLFLTTRNWETGGGRLQEGFFLLPSRAWEFLAGGLCAILGPRLRLPQAAGIALHGAGLGLIALGVALVDRNSAWPSPMTIVPVLGTALVLVAAREGAWWARLTATRKVGLWSYSIYLWHWPVVAILTYYGLTSRPVLAAGVVLSVLLGFISYELVERRLTETVWRSPRIGWPAAGAAFAGAAALAFVVMATDGLEAARFAGRPDILAALADARAAQHDWTFPKSCDRYKWDSATNFGRCEFGDAAAHDTLVIGDSFAEQLTPRFSHAFDPRGDQKGDQAGNKAAGVTFVTLGGCVPIPGVERPTPGMNCERFVDQAYRFADASSFKRVVVTAFWPGYGPDNLCVEPAAGCGPLAKAVFDAKLRAGFARMAARWRALAAAGKEVIVVDVPPYGDADPADLYAQAAAGKPVFDRARPLADFKAETRDASAMLAAAAREAGATLVDPTPALCPNGLCPLVVAGHALYKDSAHLRASTVKAPRFALYDRLIGPVAEDARVPAEPVAAMPERHAEAGGR